MLYLGLVNITAGSDLTEQLTTGFAEAQGLIKANSFAVPPPTGVNLTVP